jgi:hypothetical protein
MRRKIQLQDSVKRVAFIETDATVGATLGTDLRLPDGSVATPATLAAFIGISASATVQATSHATLQGLSAGDDHPQYTRKDTLTANGDLYVRASGAPTRLPIGADNDFLRVSSGAPVWDSVQYLPLTGGTLTGDFRVDTTALSDDYGKGIFEILSPYGGTYTINMTADVGGYQNLISAEHSYWDLQFFGSGGTIATPMTSNAGDFVGYITFAGYATSDWSTVWSWQGCKVDHVTGSIAYLNYEWYVNNDTTPQMVLMYDGGLTVGQPTGSTKGVGTINAKNGYYVEGVKIPNPITPGTLASLPSAATAGIGARTIITDATTPTFGAAAVGGGAVKIPVWSDGSAWMVG